MVGLREWGGIAAVAVGCEGETGAHLSYGAGFIVRYEPGVGVRLLTCPTHSTLSGGNLNLRSHTTSARVVLLAFRLDSMRRVVRQVCHWPVGTRPSCEGGRQQA